MGDSDPPSTLNAHIGQGFQLHYTANDALHMTMSMSSGGSNDFERQTKERPSLPFHQLECEDPISASNTPLFMRLPKELLGQIASFLPRECLNAFAGVNHGCRFLARAIQFEHLNLDYSVVSIIDSLSSEKTRPVRGLNGHRLALGSFVSTFKDENHQIYVLPATQARPFDALRTPPGRA